MAHTIAPPSYDLPPPYAAHDVAPSPREKDQPTRSLHIEQVNTNALRITAPGHIFTLTLPFSEKAANNPLLASVCAATETLDVLGPVPLPVLESLSALGLAPRTLRLARDFDAPTPRGRFTIFGRPLGADTLILYPRRDPQDTRETEHWEARGPPPAVVVVHTQPGNVRRQLSDAAECFAFPPARVVAVLPRVDAESLASLGQYVAYALHRHSFAFVCDAEVAGALLAAVGEQLADLARYVPLRGGVNLTFCSREEYMVKEHLEPLE